MTQDMYQCSKCGYLQEGRRYCMGCSAHHEKLSMVKVHTEADCPKTKGKKWFLSFSHPLSNNFKRYCIKNKKPKHRQL